MTIARQEEFVRDEILPSWFVNRLQDRVAALSSCRLDLMNATTVRVAAATGAGAAVLNIGANWRFNEAAVTRAHPGGAAGTYLVFVTAKAQDIRNAPAPGSDFTDYSFALAIVANGATPTIVPGTVDVYRRVGSLIWNGTAITGLVQEEAGAVSRPQIEVALTRPVFTALPTPLFDGQEILFQTAAMLTAGVGPLVLRYNSALSGTSKWKVLAADSWIVDVLGNGDRSSTAYGDLTDGAGPSVTPGIAGVYVVQVGCEVFNSNAASGGTPVLAVSYAIGATAVSDDDRAAQAVPQTYSASLLSRPHAKAVGAADAIVAKYAAFNTTLNGFTVSRRYLRVTPLRLG